MGRTISWSVAWGSLAVGLLLGACSSKSGSSSTAPGQVAATPVAKEDLANAFAHAVCDNEGACCTRFGFAYTQDTCIANLKASINGRLGVVDAQTHSYDPVAAGECVAAFTNAMQACVLANGFVTPDSCRHIIVGSVPTGGSCNIDTILECAPVVGAFADCSATAIGTPGQCTARPNPPVGKLGDACASTCPGESSDPDPYCPPAMAGASGTAGCFTGDELLCSSTSLTCIAFPAIGQPCAGGICTEGAFCDSTGTCSALLAAGSACTPSSACVHGTYCGPSQTCTPQQPDGSACSDDGLSCLNGACTQGKCSGLLAVDSDSCGGDVPLF